MNLFCATYLEDLNETESCKESGVELISDVLQARKALRALKGVVKLQALVRGHNVRRRAKKTLQCMQALVRAQDRVCEQRRRLSYEGSIDSMLSDSNSLWGSHFADRKSMVSNVLLRVLLHFLSSFCVLIVFATLKHSPEIVAMAHIW